MVCSKNLGSKFSHIAPTQATTIVNYNTQVPHKKHVQSLHLCPESLGLTQRGQISFKWHVERELASPCFCLCCSSWSDPAPWVWMDVQVPQAAHS